MSITSLYGVVFAAWFLVWFLFKLWLNVFFDSRKGWVSRRTGKQFLSPIHARNVETAVFIWPFSLVFIPATAVVFYAWTWSEKAFEWVCAKIRSLLGIP